MYNSSVLYIPTRSKGFPGGSVVKNPPANAGDPGDMSLIPGSARSLGRRNGNPLQYSCLKKSNGQWNLDGHSLWGRKGSDMTENTYTEE